MAITSLNTERKDGEIQGLTLDVIQSGAGVTLDKDEANNTVTINGSVQYTDSDAVSAINNDPDHGSTASHSAADVGLGDVENVALSSATWDDLGIAASDVTQSDVGLGNVDNKSAADIRQEDSTGFVLETRVSDPSGENGRMWLRTDL